MTKQTNMLMSNWVLLRRCWHKNDSHLGSIKIQKTESILLNFKVMLAQSAANDYICLTVFCLSDVEIALETSKPGWQSLMPDTRSNNIQQQYC